MKNIFLIGLPASGKSTFGKSIADALSLNHVDLDQVIEAKTNKSISTIFKLYGEKYFREIERDALRGLLDRSSTDIISCGGGTPCFYDNMNRMNAVGLTIFLDTPVAVIVKRAIDNHNRPLLKEKNLEETIIQLRTERIKYYQQANLIFNESKSLEEIIKKIQIYLKIES